MIISFVICMCIYNYQEYPKINLFMKLENKKGLSENLIKNTLLIEKDIKNTSLINRKLIETRLYTNNQITDNSHGKIQKNNQNINEKNIRNEILKNTNKENWKLEIPKIELKAQISEGTSEDILNEYIGHFEETQKKDGNIGLAAHNRGYKVNYFNRLKELKIGDEIIYTYNGQTQSYNVIETSIIEDTNWKVLENTGDNRLTLITCVENKPNLRRCVQALKKI